jgi:hypothetical protein
MSRLATARSAIFDALVPVMGEGHVHRTVPAQVVSPCCWIERPRLRPVASRSIEILATFPVAFVLDGDGEQQQIDFDELIAAAWDALTGRTMAPTAAFPSPAPTSSTLTPRSSRARCATRP